jgi:hypothetical protein
MMKVLLPPAALATCAPDAALRKSRRNPLKVLSP